ncbi:S1/P1 nuclease [Tunicatimonas pelagia]|uniref:S1/P1 nuclease n=1 Tax=Tunicatimonas pelagia TaxID=931531 RepID=UPI0026655432|nr:S1/P1 nuclease [Tunicatimonas pelagia]WKN44692.1 S1/P1 nuclease [Tunicatimonas pelagia]
MKRLLTTLLLIAVTNQLSWGWGQTGHRAIGQLAQWHLSRAAEARITQILGPVDLAMASTWMDEIRSDSAYDYTNTWHWVTVPTGTSYNPEIQEPTGDAYEATQRIIAALKSDTLPLQQEQEYLKILVHLVGDLHQPLHIGKGDDRGGNDVRVRWMYEPDSSNLHRVWDSDMLNAKQLSYTELATHLNRYVTPELVSETQSVYMEQWLDEAVELRGAVYDVPDDKRLGYEYMYHNWPIVEQRLLLAGLRLASILNDIYG